MKLTRLAFFALLAGALALGAASAADKAADKEAKKDGKTLFVDMKCNTCHTVDVAKIALRKASSDEEKGEEKSDKKAPDLSKFGDDQTAAWAAKYLLKKETIKGEKHPRRFRGSEEDLTTLTTWLGSLKAKKK